MDNNEIHNNIEYTSKKSINIKFYLTFVLKVVYN